MAAPERWNPAAAVATCPVIPWHGRAWRAHRRAYAATDHSGSLGVSGRYHRALDQFPEDQVWPALYLALGPEVCLGEVLRHIRPERLPLLNDYRISEIAVALATVLDCRDLNAVGLTHDAIWQDDDYTIPQSLAAAALTCGVEAMLVPSATRLGDILVVFPTQLRASSRLELISSRDPQLYVPRS